MSDPATPACVSLPCEPRSASAARHFATQTLREWGSYDLEDSVTLLLSEVVTNALLHTGGEVEVCLVPQPAGVRVQVADRSTAMPSLREYANDATTGRGLELVEALSSGWGVDVHPRGGKVVWFEVGGTETTHQRFSATGHESPLDTVVQLLGAPVLLFPAMHQHLEALVREYSLLGMSGSSGPWRPPRLDVDVSAVIEQLRAAGDAGRSTADVSVAVRAEFVEELESVREAVDEADHLAAAGALLAPPALPEIAGCRTWFLNQVTSQVAGAEPTPWQPSHVASVGFESQSFHASVIVDALTTAMVVADDHNRIVHANGAAEELLGWDAAGLDGQRLTVIVPERLREAHIAGYSRYLVTREPHLIGTAVQVPARRKDGTEVPVWLELSAANSGGSSVFVAMLRPAQDAAPSVSAAGAALEMIAHLGRYLADNTADVDRESVLSVLAASTGWDMATWWEPQGDAMVCVATWLRRAGAYEDLVRATRAARFTPGVGLPGRVWRDAQISWRPDVVADSNFPRAGAATASGLRGGCAFPIATGDRVVGVVELLCEQVRDRDDDIVAALAVAGTMLGLANVGV